MSAPTYRAEFAEEFSMFTLMLAKPRFAQTAIRLMLAVSLFGLASAKADTVFTITGTTANNSSISGTVTIDTVGGSVTGANITLGAPDSTTCTGITAAQGPAGTPGYFVQVGCSSGGFLMLTLRTPNDPAGGTLVGYAGGQINTDMVTFSFYAGTAGALDKVTGGSLTNPLPPTITKSFADSQIELFFGSTALTFTITNPNAASALTSVSFIDILPFGVIVSTPNNGLTSTCGGVATATPGSNIIILQGGTLAAGASCTISVNVLGAQIGVWTNTTSVVTAGPGTLIGNTASANISVVPTEFLWFFSESGGGHP
jgi:hypothetical protein